MQRCNIVAVRLGVLVLLASLGTIALADDSYSPAPAVAAPLQSEHKRHGLAIPAQHSRTRLVDGSGLSLWNDPSCRNAPQFDDWQLGRDRYAVIDPPTWLNVPPRSNAWLAVGIVSGLHMHFESPVSKTARAREIVQADPSVAFGSYCVYEEFYRTPGDPAAGGVAYWSRIEVDPPFSEPNYFARAGYPVVPPPHGQPPIHVDISWSTPAPSSTPEFVSSPSFFPPRPPHAKIRYRTGVLIGFGLGMHSGGAEIRDNTGRLFSYFTGFPMYVDGKQTHCAFPPQPHVRFYSTQCDGGWPADIVIGLTRVRVYYWHDITPWGHHVEVTDQIIKAP